MRALFQIPRNPPPVLERTDCPLLYDFVCEVLVKDLEQRPFAKELLSHPLMRRGAVVASKVIIIFNVILSFTIPIPVNLIYY